MASEPTVSSTPEPSSAVAVAEKPSLSLDQFTSDTPPAFEGDPWDLINNSGSTEEQQPEEAIAQSGTEDAQEQEGAADSTDKFVLELARLAGLDPNNPAHREALDRMAASEGIRSKFAQPAEESDGGDGDLTELERSLLEQPEEATPQAQATQQPPQPQVQQPPQNAQPQPLRLGDIGDNWKTPADSFKAEQEAWAKAQETGDYSELVDISNARTARQARAQIETFVQQWLGPKLAQYEAALQPVQNAILPQLHAQQREAQYASNRELVLEQLAATPGFGSSLIEEVAAVQPGDQVEFGGSLHPNTPFNQIVAKNPWIMDIRVMPNDARLANVPEKDRAAKAEQLEITSKYKAVLAKFREGKAGATLKPAIAKKIHDNGMKAAQRQQMDRARQAVNSGSGATGRNGAPDANAQFIKDLQRAGRGNSLTLEDIA